MPNKCPCCGQTTRNNLLAGAIRIYAQILEIRAIKGNDSAWKGDYFKHEFELGTHGEIFGLKDGSLLVKSKKGRKLWKIFQYDEADVR